MLTWQPIDTSGVIPMGKLLLAVNNKEMATWLGINIQGFPYYDFFQPSHQNRCPSSMEGTRYLKMKPPPLSEKQPLSHWKVKHPSMKWFLEKA